MVQHLHIKPTLRATLHQQPKYIRWLAFSLALLIAISSVLTLIGATRSAQAATPAYRQTSQIGAPQTLHASYFATDASNNFYAADGDNYKIRKFSPTGTLLLEFGSGEWSDAVGEFGWPSGIAVKGNGEIYLSDGDNYRINVYSATGAFLRSFGTEGSTNPGEFDYNGRIRFAPNGNLYVADGARIHIFDTNDNPISQFGTDGSAPGELSYVEGIAFDTNGDVYVADNGNNRISVYDTNWTYLRTFGQYGAYPAPNGGDLYYPGGIDVTSDGYVLVGSGNTVKWFNKATGTYVQRIGLASGLTSHTPGIPDGVDDVVVSNDGKIHVLESGMARIQTYASDGSYLSQFGDAGNDSGQFWGPLSVDTDNSDNIYVVDSVNDRIQKFDQGGNFLLAFGSEGSGNGQFRRPRDIAVSPFNGQLYVTEWTSGPQSARVQIFDQNGNYISQFGSQGQGDGQFASNTTLAISPVNGDVYVSDDSHNAGGRIQVFSATGTFLRNWSPILAYDYQNGPSDITIDSVGNIYITALGTGHIFKYNPSEQLTATLGQRAARDADEDGNSGGYAAIQVADNGMIYVADTGLHYINILDDQGKLIGRVGSHGSGQNQFEWPQDIALDSANRLIVPDDGNNRIAIYSIDNSISPPSAPQNTIASKTNNEINLTWSAPSSNGNGTIREYRIETSMLDTHAAWETYSIVPATQTSLTLSGLPADRYQVRVTAWNEAGAGTPTVIGGNIQLANPLKYERTYELPPGQDFAAGFGLYSDGSFTIPSRNLSTRLQYDTTGAFTTRLGSFGTGPTQGKYYGGADTDAADNLYVADRSNVRIDKYAKDGTLIGNYSSGLIPTGLSVDRTNGYYYVATQGAVRKYTLGGVFVSIFAPAITSSRAVDVAPDGYIYIAHQTGGVPEVAKYNAAGTKLSAFPIPQTGAWGVSLVSVAVFSSGEIVVSDEYNHIVSIFANDGTPMGTLGYSTVTDPYYGGDYFNRFNLPENITIVNDLAYIPDGRNGRVKVYSLAPAAAQTVPSTPQVVTGDTSVANEATINWAAPADDGGSAITDYLLEYKLATDSSWISVNVTAPASNQLLSGLAAGQYNVRMSATNSTGTSDTSTPLSLTVTGPGAPASAPTPPQAVTVNDSAPNTLVVNWQSPASDGGSAITSYLLEYKQTSDSVWTTASISAPNTTHTLLALSPGSYQIRLSAINAIGASTTTTPLTATISDPPTPPIPDTPAAPPANPAPSGVISVSTPSATPTNSNDRSSAADEQATSPASQSQPVQAVEGSNTGQVLVTWQPPANTHPSSYIIEYRDASIPESDTTTPWKQLKQLPGDRTSTTITLPAGEFTVRVAAVMPGDTVGRVILGVAIVKVAKAITESDGTHFTPVTTEATDTTVRNWIIACVALLAIATFFLVFLLWKKRRKKANLSSAQLPPQRWS